MICFIVSVFSITYSIARVDKKVVQFNTWDFGGQEVYYTTHQFFLSGKENNNKHSRPNVDVLFFISLDGALYLLVWNLCVPEESSRLEVTKQRIDISGYI